MFWSLKAFMSTSMCTIIVPELIEVRNFLWLRSLTIGSVFVSFEGPPR